MENCDDTVYEKLCSFYLELNKHEGPLDSLLGCLVGEGLSPNMDLESLRG